MIDHAWWNSREWQCLPEEMDTENNQIERLREIEKSDVIPSGVAEKKARLQRIWY